MDLPTSWAIRTHGTHSPPGHRSQEHGQTSTPQNGRPSVSPRKLTARAQPATDRDNPRVGREPPKGLSINIAKLNNSGVTVAKIRGLTEGKLDLAATRLITDDLFRLVCDPDGSTLILDLSMVRAMSGHFVELLSALVIRMRHQARRFVICGAQKECAQMFWNAHLKVEYLPSVNHFFGCYWLEHLARMTEQGWCISNAAPPDWD
jgi:anti-anti-sigma regulatory factor